MSTRTLLVGARFIVPSSLLTQSRLISTADIRNLPAHPVRYRRIHLIELPDKKMIGVFDNHNSVLARHRRNDALQSFGRSVNIIRTEHKQLRLFAPRQIRKVRTIHRRSETNQQTDALILAANAKSYPATKTKSCNQQWNIGKFGRKKIQRRAHIAPLTFSAIVFPFAHSRSPKIKSQHGKPQRIQRFRRLINNFVVHRAAKQRMRVTNDRCDSRRRRAWAPENGFQLPGGSGQKEIARIVVRAHRSSEKKGECTALGERNTERCSV
jgi:hypothetical protein